MDQNQYKQQVNPQYVIQSFQKQISDLSMDVANRDAVITEQYQQIAELEKELKEYRGKEIEEMDSAE